MRIHMAVLRLLTLLRASHVRMAQPTRFTSQRSAVVRMINLRDRISKRFCRSYSCYTDLQACFVCVRSNFLAPVVPPSTAFSFLRFHPNLYCPPPKSQLLLIERFYPTPPTVEVTRCFPHGTVYSILAQHQRPKFFAGIPPNNRFQHVHKFRSCKRKLLNTTVATFCRHTAHQNCKTAKFGTRQSTVRGHSTQQTTLNS